MSANDYCCTSKLISDSAGTRSATNPPCKRALEGYEAALTPGSGRRPQKYTGQLLNWFGGVEACFDARDEVAAKRDVVEAVEMHPAIDRSKSRRIQHLLAPGENWTLHRLKMGHDSVGHRRAG